MLYACHSSHAVYYPGFRDLAAFAFFRGRNGLPMFHNPFRMTSASAIRIYVLVAVVSGLYMLSH